MDWASCRRTSCFMGGLLFSRDDTNYVQSLDGFYRVEAGRVRMVCGRA